MRELFDKGIVTKHVKVSHFRNHGELTRKNNMSRNLRRLNMRLRREGFRSDFDINDFLPMTFELPSEYQRFHEEFKRNPRTVWIMKPVARSQGKGIFLFKRLKDIEAWKSGHLEPKKENIENYVVSKYINNPYLLGGIKFDLRLYVLVTSYKPLVCWFYRDGFARFSNYQYDSKSIEKSFVHLTNVAIQKTSPDYDPDQGSKWNVSSLRRYLSAKHSTKEIDVLFRKIDAIILVSLLSVQNAIIQDRHCFELYGYDILISEPLNPWLIEVNASPSMSPSSKEDSQLKIKLLSDTLDVIDMENKLRGDERKVGGFDLVWNEGGPVSPCDSPLEDFSFRFFKSVDLNRDCMEDAFPEYNPERAVEFLLTLPQLNSYIGQRPLDE